MGEVIFRFQELWQLRQLSQWRSGITLAVLPQKKSISPLLGGSKGILLRALSCACIKAGSVRGKEKLSAFSGVVKKEAEGGEERGAGGAAQGSLSCAERASCLCSRCTSNSAAGERESCNEYLPPIVSQALGIHKYIWSVSPE